MVEKYTWWDIMWENSLRKGGWKQEVTNTSAANTQTCIPANKVHRGRREHSLNVVCFISEKYLRLNVLSDSMHMNWSYPENENQIKICEKNFHFFSFFMFFLLFIFNLFYLYIHLFALVLIVASRTCLTVHHLKRKYFDNFQKMHYMFRFGALVLE